MNKEKTKKTYTAWIVCRNCGYGKPSLSIYGGKETKIPQGKKVSQIECPNCGCKELYNMFPQSTNTAGCWGSIQGNDWIDYLPKSCYKIVERQRKK